MAYSDYLTEVCDIYTITQAPDANGMTVETKNMLYNATPCVREDLSYAYRYGADRDGHSYTDVFYTNYLSNADDITDKYIVEHEGTRYRVLKAVNPMNRGHHTEIYTELIK